ncbi:hypothetical protein ALC53_05329 [Atta colombica]|uniref:Uncharacterized protein n=1 Tax=Atta colombica TaxID=520822 RepID=A0A195BJG6_9HYME|nr:hypothetical protein ALC53_05329 [Atta colombica]
MVTPSFCYANPTHSSRADFHGTNDDGDDDGDDDDDNDNADDDVDEGMIQNDRARTLYSQHGIPASQRNGCSELLIVLEYALEDTCPWRGQRHPPTFEHMHRDSSNPTESAGIRSRTRARQGSKRSRIAQGKKAPSRVESQSRYENYINNLTIVSYRTISHRITLIAKISEVFDTKRLK